MKIPVVYAMDNYGCAPTYTVKALERMGHETRRMTPGEYFASDPKEYDWFFCQDSGEGIDFTHASTSHLMKTSWWSWDSRFNRVQRKPGDDEMAAHVVRGGGWVFQAQYPDLERCRYRLNIDNMSYLPIAADPVIWQDEPVEDKIYSMSFVGNCYDPGRAAAIETARQFGLYWPGPNSTFFDKAAKIYRQSWLAFHAPTFYNLPHDVTHERVDYDLTMRPYEALSCGVPVVTSPLPDYDRQGFMEEKHIFVYRNLNEVKDTFERALSYAKSNPAQVRQDCREFIMRYHTYEHRMETALGAIRAHAGI